jgi:hypothetical protein
MKMTLEIRKEKVDDDMVYLSNSYGIEYNEIGENYIISGEEKNIRGFVGGLGYYVRDIVNPNWKLGDKKMYIVVY